MMLCNKLEKTTQPVQLETMWFLNTVQPKTKFTMKQLKGILSEDTPMSTDFVKLGIWMIAEKNCKNKRTAMSNHYMDLQFNVVIPLHNGGQYSLLIFELKHTKLCMFDANPLPLWSQKLQFKRWTQKLDDVFPVYQYVMFKLSRKRVKDYWF